ncbi:membrane dipeptidase [Thermoflexus sp.]|uniref:dipeptidase n=1 Tax=Thermoflexus sp. TaxID=1969742 RepID=UPI0025F7E5EE|nr:membrane dipeptidase [Thermoflexus sp.]MCS6963955.1 membrane dipeptidase [Thermoflexus sp.]MCX7690804.1 membrane dipeptidase [Thermoflexus sp.]MDW8184313.1 membrane dipeptidase [Anaerolineae bacterium]
MLIVDAHEDLAWNARSFGRDYTQSAYVTREREEGTEIPRLNGRCMLGLPEWLAGGVAVIFGTIFVMPARRARSPLERVYRTPEEAYVEGMTQLDYYEHLADAHPRFCLINTRRDLEAVLETWKAPFPDPDPRRIGIVRLMEGADPIRRPEEVEVWYERGVRIIGLAWGATRYAGGTGEPGPLTDEGRRLLKAMQELSIILDLSHMAERSFFEALDRYEGPVIASHSNPQAVAPGDRQLSDGMIRALADRDGVIGVVLHNGMLKKGWTRGDPKEAVTIWDAVRAIDYICQRVGDARHVGIGSDFDGGFGAESAPAEFDTVADLPKIAQALREAGFAEADIEAVMSGNWLRILRKGLP